MSFEERYVLPVEQTGWKVSGETETVFRWDYDSEREKLLELYRKGKQKQWDAEREIDWSYAVEPDQPFYLPHHLIAIYGSDIWRRMDQAKRNELRRHIEAWQISQFLHGEQGALICTAKIVQQAPDMDAKYYAATQVIDEARHVEIFARLLKEKFALAYPITPPLKALLENVASDSRWDFTYLGMQILVEGLALAAFQRIRDHSPNKLLSSINALVMQDEARHVAFGVTVLRGLYKDMTSGERQEREEFICDACSHLRARLTYDEVWDVVGLPKNECLALVEAAESTRHFRLRLFDRIASTLQEIGIYSPRVQKILLS